MADFHFNASDVQTALDAIDVAISYLSGSSPALVERFNGLSRRLISGQLYFSAGELRNICIGLELLLKEQPLNWNASRLLSAISTVCDYAIQNF